MTAELVLMLAVPLVIATVTAVYLFRWYRYFFPYVPPKPLHLMTAEERDVAKIKLLEDIKWNTSWH